MLTSRYNGVGAVASQYDERIWIPEGFGTGNDATESVEVTSIPLEYADSIEYGGTGDEEAAGPRSSSEEACGSDRDICYGAPSGLNQAAGSVEEGGTGDEKAAGATSSSEEACGSDGETGFGASSGSNDASESDGVLGSEDTSENTLTSSQRKASWDEHDLECEYCRSAGSRDVGCPHAHPVGMCLPSPVSTNVSSLDSTLGSAESGGYLASVSSGENDSPDSAWAPNTTSDFPSGNRGRQLQFENLDGIPSE